MAKIIVDTNVLIDFPTIFVENPNDTFIIHSIVAEELDDLIHNKKNNSDLSYKARVARDQILTNQLKNIELSMERSQFALPSSWDTNKNDNILLSFSKDKQSSNSDDFYFLYTNDLLMQMKAKFLGIVYKGYDGVGFGKKSESNYTGYKEIVLDDDELASHYTNPANKWELLDNQYLIIRNNYGDVVDKQRWSDTKGFIPISSKGFKSLYFGDIKPKDVYQMLAIDSLNHTDFTLLHGKAGSGKTVWSLAWIMQQLQHGKIGKIIIVFPVAKLKNNREMGFYSGDRTQKILQESLGGILSSKLGDMNMVETLITQGKLLLIPSSDIRGIEVSSYDCLYVTEAQNTDAYTMRTIVQRAKEGCKIIIEGDLLEQTDINISNKDNGMNRVIEAFKGTPYFSCVKLKNVYRSPISIIADKI